MFCRNCGKQIDSASFCESCGTHSGPTPNSAVQPTPTTPPKRRIGLWIFAGVAGLIVIAAISSSSNDNSNASSSSSGTAVNVTAAELFSAYQANEVSADNSYKGKVILATGTVQSIDKDFTDQAILSLTTSNEFMPVRVYLDTGEASKAASLYRGATVRVLCRGGGMIIGSPNLDGCKIQ